MNDFNKSQRIDRSHTQSPNANQPTTSEFSSGETIVWVGPNQQSEFEEAYSFCSTRAAQIAPRSSLEHLLDQPAQGVRRVIIARGERAPLPKCWQQVLELTPQAERFVIQGSACEGEYRSGTPWPDAQAFYWHAWNQVMPQWFTDNTTTTPATEKLTVLGITRSIDLADAIQSAIALDGHSVAWAPSPESAAIQNVDVVIWDDTAAPPTSAAQWRERLNWFDAPTSGLGNSPRRPRHLWCAGFPRYQDWIEAQRAGCAGLVSKPCADSVFRFLLNEPASLLSTKHRTHIKPLAPLAAHPLG